MYLPSHFEESRPDEIRRLVERQPLGLLVTTGAQGPIANSVPFLLDPGGAGGPGVLRAHVARANPVWRETVAGSPVLVVFQGEDAYVSPSLYAAKREHGKVVPTWNYAMVQARGSFRAIEDRDWLLRFVTRLTQRQEGGRATPWAVTDAPVDYIETMLRAIVGIEIELTSLVGKWKLGQNRSAVDREGVVRGLEEDGRAGPAALAQLMRDAGVA
jgi:transcriptional regulator